MFCAEHVIRELIFAFGFDAFTQFLTQHCYHQNTTIYLKSKLAFSPNCNDFL